jgi:peptidoglycan/xylan/chitin deacetylase (PgdA/CDA1 family)
VNRRLKRTFEWGLLSTGAAALARRINRGRGLVLLYHNVLPEGSLGGGELTLHLSQRAFAEQLDFLDKTCEVVSLPTLLENGISPPGRIRVAITFDDAYAGAMTAGVDELARRSMPATIFVPPGLLGQHAWWDIVAHRLDGQIDPVLRGRFLTAAGGRQDTALDTALSDRDGRTQGSGDSGASTLPESVRIGLADQVKAVSRRAGFSIGSHSWMHSNLVVASDSDLHAELERSLAWLREEIGSADYCLSYPYGLSSDRVAAAARQAGYSAGLLAGGGWLPQRREVDRFAIPRFDIPAGLSGPGFALRMSGIGVR